MLLSRMIFYVFSKCLFKGSMRNKVGSRWHRIKGRLIQIDSGPFGFVWGVSRSQRIYYRTGISWKNPKGSKWRKIGGDLKYISVGEFGPWGVNRYNKIWFRHGMSRGRPQGNWVWCKFFTTHSLKYTKVFRHKVIVKAHLLALMLGLSSRGISTKYLSKNLGLYRILTEEQDTVVRKIVLKYCTWYC